MHGHLATEAVRRIGKGWPELALHTEWVCLGSVFPDVGFFLPYAPFAGGPPSLRGLSPALHGCKGEDTYRILQAGIVSLRATALPEQAALRAFLAGIAAHLQADIHWHPMVYFFSGRYEADAVCERNRAQTAHRGLETVMDLQLARSGLLKNGEPSVARWLQQTGSHRRRRLTQAIFHSFGLLPSDSAALAWERAWRVFALAQRTFSCSAAGRLLAPALWSAGGALRPIAAMFYAGPARQGVSWMEVERPYRHPVSGEALTFSFEAFREGAIERTVSFWRDVLLPVLEGDGPLPFGPSLACGLPGVPESDLNCFSSSPFVPH